MPFSCPLLTSLPLKKRCCCSNEIYGDGRKLPAISASISLYEEHETFDLEHIKADQVLVLLFRDATN